VFCFVFAVKIINHGRCRGNTAQTLARWWHLVASSVALDVFHQAMHITLYHCIAMAIKMANTLPVFFVNNDSAVAHNHS
jgi:hypothetical protein